jgi:hypothetical protein
MKFAFFEGKCETILSLKVEKKSLLLQKRKFKLENYLNYD